MNDDLLDDMIDSLFAMIGIRDDQRMMINAQNIFIGVFKGIDEARLIMTDDDVLDLIMRPFANAFAGRINTLIHTRWENRSIAEMIIDHMTESLD